MNTQAELQKAFRVFMELYFAFVIILIINSLEMVLILLLIGCVIGSVLLLAAPDLKVSLKRFYDFVNYRATYIIVCILLLPLIYYIYPHFRVIIPVPLYYRVAWNFQIFMALGILAFVPVFLMSKFRLVIKIAVCILLVILYNFGGLFWNVAYLFEESQWLDDSALLGTDRYCVAVEGNNFDNMYMSDFYKCNSWGFKCEFLYGTFTGGQEYTIVTNKDMQEAYLFSDMGIRFIDAENDIYYDEQVLTGRWENFAGYDYDLDVLLIDDRIRFLLYRENQQTREREIIPFIYYIEDVGEAWSPLIDRGCCDTEEEREERFSLFLAAEKDENLFNVVADEENQAVNVYVEGELIYTYGENPRCYVEGCVIPGN